MNIVEQPWYPALCVSAQETAKDAYSLIKDNRNENFDEDFATQHDFFDAFGTAFGDTEDDEFDWNSNLSLLWIIGLRPRFDETLAGNVLTWVPVAAYNPTQTFREGYMEASVELQKLMFNDSAYVQRSWLTILEKKALTHRISRSETAAEHLFILEFEIIPNEPLL